MDSPSPPTGLQGARLGEGKEEEEGLTYFLKVSRKKRTIAAFSMAKESTQLEYMDLVTFAGVQHGQHWQEFTQN